MRERFLNQESGFTLPEVLVTMTMMITVLFALYSIFDMSIRVFSFGNDKTEAVENARLGLEKMRREMRMAHPLNKAAGDETLLFSGSDGDTIVFGNDLNGDRLVDTSAGSVELITYEKSGTSLQRNSQPAVEYVDGLTFDYLDGFGNAVAFSDADIVHVQLAVSVDGREQTLATDIALRNRVE